MAGPSTLPSVRTMSRLALPLGSTLVAGDSGLEHPVLWARTNSALSPLFPTLNAQEVALLDLQVAQTSHPHLTLGRVVRELGKLRIAGLVVKGEITQVAQREAERGNLPLFKLPRNAEINRVARAIIRLISDREMQEESQAAALYRHLSQGVAEGKGLEGLLNELQRLSGHLVSVSDLSGGILGMASAGKMPHRTSELKKSLFVGDSPIAILSLHDSSEKLDTFARIALEQGAAALTLELAKMEAVEAARVGTHGDFVATLLLGEDEGLLLSRARMAEYPLETTQWIVLTISHTHDMTDEHLQRWMRRLSTRADLWGWRIRWYVEDESISLSIPEPSKQLTLVIGGGESQWSHQRETFLDYLVESWEGKEALSVAAGQPAHGLAGLRQALRQATDALALGLRIFGRGKRYLHHDMGLYRLLRKLQGTPELDEFLAQTLAALEKYDQTHATELLKTLDVLFENGGNVSATAKAMHLHRNSLIYRLDRIHEVSQLDPTNPSDRFTLRLALMLVPLR